MTSRLLIDGFCFLYLHANCKHYLPGEATTPKRHPGDIERLKDGCSFDQKIEI